MTKNEASNYYIRMAYGLSYDAAQKIHPSHLHVDGDPWYSCALHPDAIGVQDRGMVCTCGLDIKRENTADIVMDVIHDALKILDGMTVNKPGKGKKKSSKTKPKKAKVVKARQ